MWVLVRIYNQEFHGALRLTGFDYQGIGAVTDGWEMGIQDRDVDMSNTYDKGPFNGRVLGSCCTPFFGLK